MKEREKPWKIIYRKKEGDCINTLKERKTIKNDL
jgi:hypothetical protein